MLDALQFYKLSQMTGFSLATAERLDIRIHTEANIPWIPSDEHVYLVLSTQGVRFYFDFCEMFKAEIILYYFLLGHCHLL